jgi:hypothetical protein
MCKFFYESAEQKAIRAAKKAALALKGNCVTIGCGRVPYRGSAKC